MVANGKASLIMLRKAEPEADEPDSEKESNHGDRAQLTIENYSGISIKVSFNKDIDEGLRMAQLSGGQKSLVALALIFAIQRCDPAVQLIVVNTYHSAVLLV